MGEIEIKSHNSEIFHTTKTFLGFCQLSSYLKKKHLMWGIQVKFRTVELIAGFVVKKEVSIKISD